MKQLSIVEFSVSWKLCIKNSWKMDNKYIKTMKALIYKNYEVSAQQTF